MCHLNEDLITFLVYSVLNFDEVPKSLIHKMNQNVHTLIAKERKGKR